MPSGLSTPIYETSIGWDLKDGYWTMYLAVSIKKNATKYISLISGVSLRTLLDNPSTTISEIENNWKEITFSGNTKGQNKNLTWYNPANSYAPSLLILSENANLTTNLDVISNIILGTSQSETDVGSIANVGTFYPVAVRNIDSLVTDNVIIAASNISGQVDEVFSDNGVTFRVYPTIATLEPVVVLYNNNYFIIEGQGTRISRYAFNKSTLSNTNVAVRGSMGATLNNVGLHGNIESIIVKHGYYFVQGGYFYVFYSLGHIYEQKSFNLSNKYQILVDTDDDNRIYAMPEGLECKINGSCSTITCSEIDDPFNGINQTSSDRLCFKDYVQVPMTDTQDNIYPTGIFFARNVI